MDKNVASQIYDIIKDFDPVATAETEMGSREAGLPLALNLMGEFTAMKRELLTAMEDIHFSSKFSEALDVLKKLGFEIIYTGYMSDYNPNDERDTPHLDTFHVLWNPMGLLATAESYSGNHVNTIKVMGNWVGERKDLGWGISNGGVWINHEARYDTHPDAWVFDFDGQEGVKHNLEHLLEKGKFLTEWLECPFLWFLTYMDTKVKNYDRKAINERVFNTFPKHVQEAMLSKNVDKKRNATF